jgi:hypothetical protein
MDDDLRDLDAGALLAAASSRVRARRLAEVDDLQVLAQWAAVHSSDPTRGPEGALARRVGDVLVQVGGEGTPGVQDFCLGEIAVARGTGVMATRNALGDTLDLIHRLPRVWAACRSGQAEVWVARRVAKLSRQLGLDRVGVVDAAVARVITTEAAGRVLAVAEAKVVEADLDGHRSRVAEERRRRHVAMSRTDEAGLRTVIARVTAGEAAWVDATVTRAAELLATQHPGVGRDELRAIAFGYLARPAELLTLLLEHTEDPADDATSEGATSEGAPSEEDAREPHRAWAFPTELLAALRSADLSPLAPRCTFYVHLHEAALLGAPGVARVEGLGPVALPQLAELLGRTQLVVQPVIDLADRIRVTAYEHPESLKERVHLVTGGDYWPYATSTGRAVDPIPYVPPDRGGPPGQTGIHNSGPLGRRHHRWKTHAGYRSRQSGHGRYAWLTPHGMGYLVDHRGTRRIDPDHARMISRRDPSRADPPLAQVADGLGVAVTLLPRHGTTLGLVDGCRRRVHAREAGLLSLLLHLSYALHSGQAVGRKSWSTLHS